MTDAGYRLVSELRGELLEAGFDLVQPFSTAAAGDAAALSGEPPGRLGLVIGNTRLLWPKLLDYVERSPSAARSPHPLDDYTETSLKRTLERHARNARCYFAHALEPIPIQRIAERAGLAALAPCHLSIHPAYGLWIALRAAVVFDLPALEAAPAAARPCERCDRPCMPALEAAAKTSAASQGRQRVEAHWEAWLAVRDSCPVGPAWRYTDDQIGYHYAGKRPWLSRG